MTVIDHTVLLGSREGLLNELDAIAVEGWEGQRARRLLVHVRVAIVHPQVVSARLTGSIAEQAEATGWEVAWEALTHARLREVDSPWGWICVAVQRAIRNEVTGARYLTTESKGRRAFAAQASTDTGTHLAPPLSLTQLVEMGWEPEEPAPTFASLGSGLEAVLEALVAAGWQEAPPGPSWTVSVLRSRGMPAVATSRRAGAAWQPVLARRRGRSGASHSRCWASRVGPG